jgi:putative mRNA 3-end processing factor
VDTLIIESTYGLRVQEDRKKEERRLRHTVDETIGNGGIVLIPVLAVGRAQEVLLILQDHAKKMALDGMAKLSSEIVSEYGAYIKKPREFRELLKKIKFLRSDKDRDDAIEKYPIIVATAGMLSGGPAVRYLRELQEHKHSSIIFTSFLAEESPGYALTQTGIFENEEERFDVKGAIHQVELSAHADRNGLMEIIEKTKPETVICIHGDNCPEFAKSISELGINAFAPKDGEKIRI